MKGTSLSVPLATVSEEPAVASGVGGGVGAGTISTMLVPSGSGVGAVEGASVSSGMSESQSFPLPFDFPLLPHDGAVGPDLPLLPLGTHTVGSGVPEDEGLGL